jgi:hypothetical protein
LEREYFAVSGVYSFDGVRQQEAVTKLSLVLLGILLAGIGTRAAAQNYPWCANFADGAGTNCGFSSAQQCMAAAMGSGGFCEPNNQYKPSAEAAPSRHRVRSHHARKTS